MKDPTEALAEFVAGTPASTIPADVRRAALLTVADSVGTAIAGTAEPAPSVIRRSLLRWNERGSSFVLGAAVTATPPAAAAINAAAAHALDFDSISFAVSGFVGSAELCALSAVVDDAGPGRWTGDEVLTAYILGWEGAAALARAVNPRHYAIGWHPTSTLGGFAATLAVTRLLGLGPSETRAAIAIAVAEASGVKTMVGNMANAWHVGKAARNGVIAAHLAADGFTGHPAALEAPMGFLNLFNGVDQHDPDAIDRTAGSVWDLLDPGPIVKMYPCCGLIHSALDAVLELRERHHIEPADVTAVEVLFHEFIPGVMNVDVPEDAYAAKFSVPYCVATTLLDGRCDLRSFDTVRPDVVALGSRVRHGVHPELRGGETFLAEEFTDVVIRTPAGDHERRVHRMQNRGTGGHLETARAREKLEACLEFGAWPGGHRDVWDRVTALDGDGPWDPWGREPGTAADPRGGP